MPTETDALAQEVQRAATPAELFGAPGTPERAAKRTFRRYAARLHPDRAANSGADLDAVTAAFDKLVRFYDIWIGKEDDRETAGPRRAHFTVTGNAGTYTAVDQAPARGTVSAVYAATATDGTHVAIKVPRRRNSNSYIENERRSLADLALFTTRPGFEWLAPYLPTLTDTASVEHDDGRREINILGALGAAQGFVDLATVSAAMPHGMDGRDWAWIYRRLLRAIAAIHAAGHVHGAIVADNVLIHPEGHGVVLAGWTLATRPGQPLPGRIASAASAYPPEADQPVTPALDVYMLHALMVQLLTPSEHRQLAYARGCMQTAPGLRPHASDLVTEYDELLEDLYGRRTFRHFPYTVATANPA